MTGPIGYELIAEQFTPDMQKKKKKKKKGTVAASWAQRSDAFEGHPFVAGARQRWPPASGHHRRSPSGVGIVGT